MNKDLWELKTKKVIQMTYICKRCNFMCSKIETAIYHERQHNKEVA